MKVKKILSLFFCLAILSGVLVGCGNNTTSTNQDNTKITAQMFSDSDMDVGYDENNCITVTLSDNGTKADSQSVKISENTVTIADEGTYLITGSLTNGQIIVDAEKTDKLQIVLDNVAIGSSYSAPIYVKQADKVFITLANNSQNTLSVNGEFTAIDDNNIDAVIYSQDDLTINGDGSLTVSTQYGNGITSKDDLILTGGVYSIASSGHGLEGKDSVRIANGEFNITSGKDGINSENADDATLGFVYIADGAFQITAQTDGIDGAVSVQLESGDFNIIAGGGSGELLTENSGAVQPHIEKEARVETETTNAPSTKAIKAAGTITINNGNYHLNSLDDSIHANEDVLINGGNFTLATSDDGIHADSNATIKDGSLSITKCNEGIEGQSIIIKGGTIDLVCSDDGLNAAGGNDSAATDSNGRAKQDSFATDENAYIKITGGITHINANGDGVDSNGNLYITGGETYVIGPTNNGNGAVDYNGTAKITGGIFLASGASQMAQNFGDDSTQASMLVTAPNMQSGDIVLKDSDGNELLSYTPSKEYNCVIISAPSIKKGDTYTVTMGSDTQTVEMTSLIYGASGRGGNPTGGVGGNGGDGVNGGGNGGERPSDMPY